MRTPLIASFVLAVGIATTPVSAQRIDPAPPATPAPPAGAPSVGAPYAAPASAAPASWPAPPPAYVARPSRWGEKIGGRWHAGMAAPGGWSAHRSFGRGRKLPRYWRSPRYFIDDYSAYGLTRPPRGYGWLRYYDDAVLVDGDARVWDQVDDVAWDSPHVSGCGAAHGCMPSYIVDGDYHVEQSGIHATGPACGCGAYINGAWYPAAISTRIIVESRPIVTTREYLTTTTTFYRTGGHKRAPTKLLVKAAPVKTKLVKRK